MRNKKGTRRAFLKVLGAASLAVPIVSMIGCEDDSGSNAPDAAGKVAAYKLSRRGQRSCEACKAHARFKLFSSSGAANANRAHAGCNCKIKVVRIPEAEANRYFADSSVYDRRTGA